MHPRIMNLFMLGFSCGLFFLLIVLVIVSIKMFYQQVALNLATLNGLILTKIVNISSHFISNFLWLKSVILSITTRIILKLLTQWIDTVLCLYDIHVYSHEGLYCLRSRWTLMFIVTIVYTFVELMSTHLAVNIRYVTFFKVREGTDLKPTDSCGPSH